MKVSVHCLDEIDSTLLPYKSNSMVIMSLLIRRNVVGRYVANDITLQRHYVLLPNYRNQNCHMNYLNYLLQKQESCPGGETRFLLTYIEFGHTQSLALFTI